MVFEKLKFILKTIGCLFYNCRYSTTYKRSKENSLYKPQYIQIDSVQATITINFLLQSGWINLHTNSSLNNNPFFPKRMSAKKDSLVKSLSIKDIFVKKGHLVIKDGRSVYKKTSSQTIMAAMQLGIGYSVGRLSAKPERDVLIQDFSTVEHVWFPAIGTKETPSHKFNDFNIKTYAPIAFRYFREIFGIKPSDFMLSLSVEPLSELSNPGASGSLFFISKDDIYIIKTVQHQEADFLQRLLPGYYMNLHQNPMTLLPKFLGLYCYQTSRTNIRLVVMNNILPSSLEYIQKYDLKGSTYKRSASEKERCKSSPVFKDLDFLEHYQNGIQLDNEVYDSVIKTLERDIRVLESFKIMDYSLLIGVVKSNHSTVNKNILIGRTSSNDKRNFSRAMRTIINGTSSNIYGGIPAFNDSNEELLLFMGLIDILQSYRVVKKLEHQWKSMLHDGNTISVHNPQFYANRFLDFCRSKIFRRKVGLASARKKGTPQSISKNEKIESVIANVTLQEVAENSLSQTKTDTEQIIEETVAISSNNGVNCSSGLE